MTIAVFDSGVGGLTVLRAVHQRLPGANTAYLGDTARVPYGTRSPHTVIRYALNAARFLVERSSPSALVIACNTASAVAIDALSEAFDIPVVGVVEPTARRAVEMSSSGTIGVIGTRGTIQSGKYQRAVESLSPDAKTVAHPCPLFVPLAEEGWTDPADPIVRGVAERYMAPFIGTDVDTLILGCTHYPLLADAIAQSLPESVRLADAGESVAAAVAGQIGEREHGQGFRRYYVTDVPKGFAEVAERFLGGPIEGPEEVDL